MNKSPLKGLLGFSVSSRLLLKASVRNNIPAIYAEVDGVYTTTAPVDAYRGAGRPEATFVIERLVEAAAREIGRDPAEFRRQNFIDRKSVV